MTQELIMRLNQMSAAERSAAFSQILNRFCVGCGCSGDFSQNPCDCEPGNPQAIDLDQAAE